MILLNQIFWKKDQSNQSFTIPVAINPKYLILAIEDEVANKTPIIGEKYIEKATALIMEGTEEPVMVKESLEEVLSQLV